VSRIDPATDSVMATIPVGDGPDSLAVVGDSVWVANRVSSTLTRIDATRNSAASTVAIGGSPVALTARGSDIWTATRASLNGLPRGGTLRVVLSTPPSSIDPALTYPSLPFQFYEGVYDALVTFQRVGGSGGLQLVPDLALTIPSPTAGGTVYSFVLRPGLRYSDGQPVRPEDFRRGLERDLELNASAATFLTGIVGAASCLSGKPCDLSRGITVSDRADVVTFHLVAPDASFLDKLTFLFTAPVPPGTPAHDVGDHPVPSTGPYMIGSYTPGREVVFVRNPYFREWSAAAEPAGSPDRIVWTFGASMSHEVLEVEHGQADWTADGVPDVAGLLAQFPSQVHVNPALYVDYASFNTRVAPFNDPRVRRAFSLAANRSDLVHALGGPSAASPTCQILPPGIPGFRRYCPFTTDPGPNGAWLGPDLAAARKLVAESGTRGMKVTVWSHQGMESTGAFMVSVLRQLGYRASMITPTPAVLARNVNDSRRGVQATDTSWLADYPAASDFFDELFRCSAFRLADPAATRDGSFFCDPTIDALMNDADREQATDPASAAATWAVVDRDVTDAAPWVPLVDLTWIDFLSTRVGNYEYDLATGGPFLDQMYVRQGKAAHS
jgi:ABC-type transport system substrate-binding protein